MNNWTEKVKLLFTFVWPGDWWCRWARWSRDDIRFCWGSQLSVCFFLSWSLHPLGVFCLGGTAFPLWVRPRRVYWSWAGSWSEGKSKQKQWANEEDKARQVTELNPFLFIPLAAELMKQIDACDVNHPQWGWSRWQRRKLFFQKLYFNLTTMISAL